MSNKGKILVFCKECNKKRFCTKERIPNINFKYTCSRNHSWIIKGVTPERINAAISDIILPSIKEAFNRDNKFFEYLSKKK
jgi:superoxide dismutase